MASTIAPWAVPRPIGNVYSRYYGGPRRIIEPLDIVSWAQANFDIVDVDGETRVMPLYPHQMAILKHCFTPSTDGRFPYSTIVYATPKKSGKTTIAALVARWVAETQGPYAEVLCVANDFDQAKNRAFKAIEMSIGLHPDYNVQRRQLTDQWTVRDKELTYHPNSSSIKALASDYKGEAGANPTLTVWTELWGYVHEASLRLWAELTPVATRPVSMRFVETYAGFEGESELLWGLYDLGVLQGRQLTAGELGSLDAFAEAPNYDSLVPCWVNDGAGLFVYWDAGVQGRRMPWQHGEQGQQYYAEQEAMLTPNQYARMHLNEWAGGESEFVPIEWWDACQSPMPPLRERKDGAIQEPMALVVGCDAGVSGDCTACVVVSRHPLHSDHVAVRALRVWEPPAGGKMDYSQTLTSYVDWLISNFRVVQVAYDPYQLHQWAVDQRKKEPGGWYREFAQGAERLIADKGLYDLIRDRRIHHQGDMVLREHIQNCAAKIPKDEENKLRLVKKSERQKIDAAVALSMAARECLRLNL